MKDGESRSPWSLDGLLTEANLGPMKNTFDVAVIGAGIAGLTSAYLLARAGKTVAVLDAKERIAAGETEMTTAHLAWYIDDGLARLASIRGDEAAKLAVQSHREAIDLIGHIAGEEKIDCDYRRLPGYLFPGVENVDIGIEDEIKVLNSLGIPYEKVDRAPLAGDPAGPALRLADQGQFHPLRYLRGVAEAVRRLGGTVRTATAVSEIAAGDLCELKLADGQTVRARDVVVATNTPYGVSTAIHLKLASYNTYAVALDTAGAEVPQALLWDTEDPYHYVRGAVGSDGAHLLIVGGEDHRTGQAGDQEARWNRLEEWTRRRFPGTGKRKHHWSGQVFETPDGLGLIGLAPGSREHLYVITGDSGMGMTHGTLGGKLVSDLILGRTSPYAGIYSPSRWMPGALGTLFGDNANHVAQYRDWLTGGDVASIDQIPNGQGAIVRRGLTKLAVYRDDSGKVETMSAVCPHMGAIVAWNPGEKTWDCPCHGSRFQCDGETMHGPAGKGLEKVK